MKYGYIYKTTNLLNDRIYIGQRRGEFNKEYLGSGIVILKAIKKYGRDNFAVILLGQAHNKKSLDILEKYYIIIYKKRLPNRFMYNLANGGQGGNLYYFHKKSCDCPFCKARRGELKGRNAIFYGKSHSEKTLKRMRHSHNISEEGMRVMQRPKPCSEKAKKKLRKAMTSRRYSDEINKKKASPGKLNGMFGKGYLLNGKRNGMYERGSSKIALKGWETRRLRRQGCLLP